MVDDLDEHKMDPATTEGWGEYTHQYHVNWVCTCGQQLKVSAADAFHAKYNLGPKIEAHLADVRAQNASAAVSGDRTTPVTDMMAGAVGVGIVGVIVVGIVYGIFSLFTGDDSDGGGSSGRYSTEECIVLKAEALSDEGNDRAMSEYSANC